MAGTGTNTLQVMATIQQSGATRDYVVVQIPQRTSGTTTFTGCLNSTCAGLNFIPSFNPNTFVAPYSCTFETGSITVSTPFTVTDGTFDTAVR